ncbi:MAG TPA: VWA domain-containing protein [Ktedonobacterales bacterium]
MRWRLLLCAIALAALTLTLVSPSRANARGATPAQALAAASAAASAGHVTMLVLDMSGSMATNDPNGLRCSAANAFIDLSGPGDYIGVIGLDSSGSGGPSGFGVAQLWAHPAEMATVANRAALRQTIAQRSQSCRPDGATPTYDALAQALALLKNATAQSGLTGSVILLTDGAPDPQQDAQIGAIQRDLLPQYKQAGFPIDAIALGSEQGLHPFLSGLADATGGSFYDDGHGAVPGVSALNIAPFFVDIFAQRNGRIASHDIPPTQLNGATVSRNFSVGDFVSQLSVVAVKDSPDATVTLTAPNGQTLSSSTAGILYSDDPHYAMFSIPNPQQGAWQVNAHGSGLFLMDSLKLSTLALNIVTPSAQSPVAPLGQPLSIAAVLKNGDTPVSGSRYSLTGTLVYAGGAGQYSQDFVLDDSASPGTYKAQAQAPESAPAGAYTLTVVAREISDTIASVTRSVRIERFPTPALLSPTTRQPVTGTVSAQVTQWDPILRALYGAPVGLLGWLGQWPLRGLPAQPAATLHGQVTLGGAAYPNAQVSGFVTRAGASGSAPLTVSQQGGGAFTAYVPAAATGTYTLTLDTQGAFQDSHGDFGVTTRQAQVTLAPASVGQEVFAWAITLLYAALIFLLVLLIRYGWSPRPHGMLVSSDGGGGEEFARARRGPYALLHPSVVLSQHMGLGPGVAFLFRRGGGIQVKGVGPGARDFRMGGDPLPTHAVSATESTLSAHGGELSYVVSAAGADDDEEVEEAERGGRRGSLLSRRSRAEDDEFDDAPRRGLLFGRRRAERDDDDDDEWRPARRSRARGRYSDDEDDLGSSRSARSRGRDVDDDDERVAPTRRRRAGRARYDDDEW